MEEALACPLLSELPKTEARERAAHPFFNEMNDDPMPTPSITSSSPHANPTAATDTPTPAAAATATPSPKPLKGVRSSTVQQAGQGDVTLPIQEALSFFEHLEQLNALASANAPSTAALLNEANPWAAQQAWQASNAASTQVQVLPPSTAAEASPPHLYPSGVEALSTPARTEDSTVAHTQKTKAPTEPPKPLPAHLLQAQAPFWQQLLRHEALNERLGHGTGQGEQAQRQPNATTLEAATPAKSGLSARMVQWLEHSGRKGQPIRVTVDETLSLVLRISQGKVRAEFISAQGQHMAGLQAQVSALYQQLQQQKLPVANFIARSERREEGEARQQQHANQNEQPSSQQ